MKVALSESTAFPVSFSHLYEAEQYFGRRLPLLVREGGGPEYRWRLGPDRGHRNETISHVSAKSKRCAI
jgi:hypothetical protein